MRIVPVVVDSSVIINAYRFLLDSRAISGAIRGKKIFLVTVPSVLDEIKSRLTSVVGEILKDRITLIAPEKKFLDAVVRKAKEAGLYTKVSAVDTEIIALGLQLKEKYGRVIIATEDLAIQDLCVEMALEVLAFRKKIRYLVQRRKKCLLCGYEYPEYLDSCPSCGSKVYRYIIRKVRIK